MRTLYVTVVMVGLLAAPLQAEDRRVSGVGMEAVKLSIVDELATEYGIVQGRDIDAYIPFFQDVAWELSSIIDEALRVELVSYDEETGWAKLSISINDEDNTYTFSMVKPEYHEGALVVGWKYRWELLPPNGFTILEGTIRFQRDGDHLRLRTRDRQSVLNANVVVPFWGAADEQGAEGQEAEEPQAPAGLGTDRCICDGGNGHCSRSQCELNHHCPDSPGTCFLVPDDCGGSGTSDLLLASLPCFGVVKLVRRRRRRAA